MTEFNSPPLTRRELRERERQAQAGEAAAASSLTSVSSNSFDASNRELGAPEAESPFNTARPTSASSLLTPTTPSAAMPAAPATPSGSPLAAAERTSVAGNGLGGRTASVGTETGALGLSRKELRRLREAAERVGIRPEIAAQESAPPETVEPVARPTQQAGMFAQSLPQSTASNLAPSLPARTAPPTLAPSSVETSNTPLFDSTATGPIHWTEALALPADVDPNDSANFGNAAIVSDSSMVIIGELPGVNTPTALTGELDIVVTGTIHLPASLSETGALPDILDSAKVVANEDVIDEPSVTGMTPISASSSVSAQAVAPQIVAPLPKERASTGMILAFVSAGVAGIAILAVGVGVFLGLF